MLEPWDVVSDHDPCYPHRFALSNVLRSGASVAAWVWLIWLIRRQIMRVRSYRAGRTGEATVLDALRQSLDQRWTIERGLQLPNRRDDLDLVLVGPSGVWAIQVKAFRNRVRVHEGRWE